MSIIYEYKLQNVEKAKHFFLFPMVILEIREDLKSQLDLYKA